uniref:Si:ch211-256a21.4 n=1 Tax=Cyprinodon variegatus TaxID=28743 RepID=A0A3Q2EE72_CYPVA
RFRLAQSCLGLTGCLFVCISVCTPYWLKNRGLWTNWNNLEAERVFGVISFVMAVSTAALCLLFALCWTSQTVLSYSNTRSLLMAGQALYPTTLLLLTMASTFFFLLSWSFFTYQHKEEIRQEFSSLGFSYWLGALGWFLLLVVEAAVFIAEQAVVPDVIPDIEKAVNSLRTSDQPGVAKRALSDGYKPVNYKSNIPKRYTSVI